MSDELSKLQEELVATMIMEERPDTLLINDLACESRSDDGSAVWHARLLLADGPGQMREEEVRALVSADGNVSLI